MKTKIVKVGNSQGIRIPKTILRQVGFSGDIDMEVIDNSIVLKKLDHPRAGWEEAFKRMAENGDDKLPDWDVPNLSSLDQTEWEW